MEEDIKILEEMITWDCLLPNKRQTEAIENLIKGYKRVRAGRNWLSERISAQIATPELFDKILEEDYIPKSKVKEKIDYYIGMYEIGKLHEDEASKHQMEAILSIINDLQELMEDK